MIVAGKAGNSMVGVCWYFIGISWVGGLALVSVWKLLGAGW